jgi:hypothetical protein
MPNSKKIKDLAPLRFFFLLIGMFVGLIGGALITYNLDTPKGWNPFGWWFPATFVSTVFCGLLGLLLYEYHKKKA